MSIDDAIKAHREKSPIVAKWPFSNEIEYKCIARINKDNRSVILEDKCGHSTTIANLKDIKLKN